MSSFALGRQVRDLYRAAAMRKLSGEAIAGDSSLTDFTNTRFEAARNASNALPVLIPARNEGFSQGKHNEPGLAATLLSLARTKGNAYPVVINNRSTDNTADVARTMGATLIDAPSGKKMAATQKGLTHVKQASQVLFTDADTFFPTNWPLAMTAAMEAADKGTGVALFGSSLAVHKRIKPIVDGAICVNNIRKNVSRVRHGSMPVARGHNYGLRFDEAGNMLRALETLSPDIFLGDDTLIAQTLGGEGAQVIGSTNPDTLVLTLNDRINTVGEVMGRLIGKTTYDQLARQSYVDQYGAEL